MVAVAGLRRLASLLDGTVVLPGDDAYAAARPVRTRSVRETLPCAVVRCVTPADVSRAVSFVREHDLPFAVRGRGHSLADRSTTFGVLIDLGAMASIRVSSGLVTVGPGVQIGALADRLAADGLLVPCGWCPTVGVTGAALGGGFGTFGRRYGLACDHLVAADVVLADGRLVHAPPDLLWALRGAGGGQFGIVTSLTLRPRPAPPSTMFALMWRYDHAAVVVDAWQRWAPSAPDTVNAELVLVMGPDPVTIPLVVVFGVVVGGDAGPVLDRFARDTGTPPWRRFVTPLSGPDAARHHHYAGAAANTGPVTGVPQGTRPGRRVLRSHFVDRPLPADAVDRLVESVVTDRVPGQYREVELVPWGGAYSRVPVADAAFAHRDPLFLVEHNADVPATADDAAREAVARWVTRSWSTIRPWESGAVYPNYPDPDLPDWLRAYHGPNLERLVDVKTTHDPDNVFHHPQSVTPTPLAADTTGPTGMLPATAE